MTTREQLTFERVIALLRMIEDSGGSPQGALPPTGYITSLLNTSELGQGKEVSRAHRNDTGPPDFTGP